MKPIDDYTIGELKELIAKKEKKDWKEQAKGEYYVAQKVNGHYEISVCDLVTDFSYKNEKEAKIAAKKMDLMNRMNLFALIHNEGWKADWEDYKFKWGLAYYSGGTEVDYSTRGNNFLFGISVKSEEIAKAMLEEFKDELDIYLQ